MTGVRPACCSPSSRARCCSRRRADAPTTSRDVPAAAEHASTPVGDVAHRGRAHPGADPGAEAACTTCRPSRPSRRRPPPRTRRPQDADRRRAGRRRRPPRHPAPRTPRRPRPTPTRATATWNGSGDGNGHGPSRRTARRGRLDEPARGRRRPAAPAASGCRRAVPARSATVDATGRRSRCRARAGGVQVDESAPVRFAAPRTEALSRALTSPPSGSRRPRAAAASGRCRSSAPRGVVDDHDARRRGTLGCPGSRPRRAPGSAGVAQQRVGAVDEQAAGTALPVGSEARRGQRPIRLLNSVEVVAADADGHDVGAPASGRGTASARAGRRRIRLTDRHVRGRRPPLQLLSTSLARRARGAAGHERSRCRAESTRRSSWCRAISRSAVARSVAARRTRSTARGVACRARRRGGPAGRLGGRAGADRLAMQHAAAVTDAAGVTRRTASGVRRRRALARQVRVPIAPCCGEVDARRRTAHGSIVSAAVAARAGCVPAPVAGRAAGVEGGADRSRGPPGGTCAVRRPPGCCPAAVPVDSLLEQWRRSGRAIRLTSRVATGPTDSPSPGHGPFESVSRRTATGRSAGRRSDGGWTASSTAGVTGLRVTGAAGPGSQWPSRMPRPPVRHEGAPCLRSADHPRRGRAPGRPRADRPDRRRARPPRARSCA